jgi:hypothetical protein
MAEIKKCEDCLATPCDCNERVWGYAVTWNNYDIPTTLRGLSRHAAMASRWTSLNNPDVNAISCIMRDMETSPLVWMVRGTECADCKASPCDCNERVWGYSIQYKSSATRHKGLTRATAIVYRESAFSHNRQFVTALSSVVRDTETVDMVDVKPEQECAECKASTCDCNEPVWGYSIRYKSPPIHHHGGFSRSTALDYREFSLSHNRHIITAISCVVRDTEETVMVDVKSESECADCKASPCDCNERVWGYSIRYRSSTSNNHHKRLTRSTAIVYRESALSHNRHRITAISAVIRDTETIDMVDVKPEPESLQESTPVTGDTLNEERLAYLLAETDDELTSIVERVSDGNDERREVNIAIAVKRDEAGALTRARAIAKRVVAVLQRGKRS